MPRQSVSVAVIALRSLLLLLLFTRCACAGRSVAWHGSQPAHCALLRVQITSSAHQTAISCGWLLATCSTVRNLP
jgi:hypothetical protein